MSEASKLDLPWWIEKRDGKRTILIRKATPPDDDEVRPNVCVIESRTLYAGDCAEFIVEASAVAHETGRTPKQLAEERAELLAAHEPERSGPAFLDWIADRLVHVYHESPEVDFVLCLRRRAEKARAAIAKATGERT